MKICNVSWLIILLGLMSCRPNNKSDMELGDVESSKGDLVHVVYFDLKDGMSKDSVKMLIDEIERLKEIPSIRNLEIGKFTDLDDKRAMSHLELVMSMSFNSQEDYNSYQIHPIHIGLKSNCRPFIAGPPVTYNYIIE